jgi:glycosyltransferase involved in cell wall biosynthesis
MRTPLLSVILCTHNPREDYLALAMEGLANQSLARDAWELIVVDNASDPPVARRLDLSWHPGAIHVSEPEPGLTMARLAGFSRASAPLFVLVDDDTVLDPGYLAEVLAIAARFPMMGAWGGSAIGVYEQDPPTWFRPYEPILSVRSIDRDAWTNQRSFGLPMPIGAGMVVRRDVASRFAGEVLGDPRRKRLGRNRDLLVGGEDLALALTGCDMGYGRGVFASLSLRHHIPARRIAIPYLKEIIRGTAFSNLILRYLRGEISGHPPGESLPSRIRRWKHGATLPPHARMYDSAWRSGEADAYRLIASSFSEIPSPDDPGQP